MREFNLSSFAAFCSIGGELMHDIEIAKKTAIHVMAQMIAAEAKRVLGTYDYKWTQLAAATQADRMQAGFPANEPLLRTGELRDSIGYKVISDHEAEVGSNLEIAVYQELGTVHIPPRSFLAAAAAHKGEDAAKVAGKIIADAIREANHILHIETEIWRIAIDAAKELGHTIREAKENVDPDKVR
ncbi:Bacteriophage HK97-gp10, putative tail-component [Bradyrhizobium erythrophlei]|nr:Bacteriophage HK97-gp10, putative tail-component [Bradyrhizobium erythrophlei]